MYSLHFWSYSDVLIEAPAPALRTPRTTLPTALFSKLLTRETAPNYFSSFFIDYSRYTQLSKQVQKIADLLLLPFLLHASVPLNVSWSMESTAGKTWLLTLQGCCETFNSTPSVCSSRPKVSRSRNHVCSQAPCTSHHSALNFQ